MERQSDKHSPWLDDALEHEVESLTRGAPIEARADSSREMEAAADGEPSAEAVLGTAEEPPGAGSLTSCRRTPPQRPRGALTAVDLPGDALPTSSGVRAKNVGPTISWNGARVA